MNSFNPLTPGSAYRLSAETRQLAEQYLRGEFRHELREADFNVADLGLTTDCPPLLLHARVAEMIAARAPVIVRPEELLVGNALLLPALRHEVPGMPGISSISHTTVDFGDAVRRGLVGLEYEILSKRCETSAEQTFVDALLTVIGAMRNWVRRYRDECLRLAGESDKIDEREKLMRTVDHLAQIPENPPRNFCEALQSFWFFFEFQRLCGNWSGLGRFDWILGPYLEHDLAAGILTLDEAREWIAHFWIKGTEWCYGMRKFNPGEPGSGDAQFYQNIILGGAAPDGAGNVENTVTDLVLDVIEELHISDYPVAVRLNRDSTPALLRRIAEVQLLGGGIVSVYNEAVVLEGLRLYGFPENEIREFTNDGCWEVILPGRTAFAYTPFDALRIFQQQLLADDTPDSFEALFDRYSQALRERIDGLKRGISERYAASRQPDAVLSLLMPSCRRRRRSYTDFGPDYTVNALHAGGLPDVANSLWAIRYFVFEQKRLRLEELVGILRDDWRGHETLRLEIADSLRYYGNDDDGADAMMKRVLDDYACAVADSAPIPNVLTPAGVSTFGREIQYAPNREATAFGRHAHEYLAPNLSPTPGTEKESLTAVVNSYCKMDFTGIPNGCPLDLRLSAGMRKLPDAPGVLARVLEVFCRHGGFYMQIDAVDADMLREAQKDPDRFPNLVVRISGWSARFASLSEPWQQMIIRRTALEQL